MLRRMTVAPATTTLPDGRRIHCVNPYEVDFSVHEIFGDDLRQHGIDLPAGSVILDVGANIGLFALYLVRAFDTPRIFAYEPMPAAHAALAANITDLVPNARAFAFALGAAPGHLEFDYFPGLSALSTAHHDVGAKLAAGLKQLLAGGRASDEVRDIIERTGAADRIEQEGTFLKDLFRSERVRSPVDTVSRQIAALGLDRVDLLKVDTEGAEFDVLAGVEAADWPRIRQLMVEVHVGYEATERLVVDLTARGYRAAIGEHPLAQGGAPVFHVYATRGPAA
jgi:FkbM family methyltransferase